MADEPENRSGASDADESGPDIGNPSDGGSTSENQVDIAALTTTVAAGVREALGVPEGLSLEEFVARSNQSTHDKRINKIEKRQSSTIEALLPLATNDEERARLVELADKADQQAMLEDYRNRGLAQDQGVSEDSGGDTSGEAGQSGRTANDQVAERVKLLNRHELDRGIKIPEEAINQLDGSRRFVDWADYETAVDELADSIEKGTFSIAGTSTGAAPASEIQSGGSAEELDNINSTLAELYLDFSKNADQIERLEEQQTKLFEQQG